MKRILEIYSFVLVCLVFFMAGRPGSVVASQQAQEFLGGIRHYESKAYGSAIEAFSKLVEKGVRNGKLYYNLANAYLKNGDIGPAILWYERALKLLPNDPDVRFNLTYADTLATDKKESFASPLMTVMFFWKDLFSPATWKWIALLCNAIFWGFWGAWFWFRKRAFKTIGYCFLVVTCISLGTIIYHTWTTTYRPQAVILPASVSVRSGFAPESTELFVLHAGTRVVVEKRTKGFYKIRFSKDKLGWITDTVAGII